MHIFFVLFFLIPCNVSSQPNTQLRINSLSHSSSLSQNKYNYYHYLDSRGLIWISSIQGLNLFDGHQVQVYRSDRADTTTLLTDAASQGHIQEDRWGTLWMSNAECLIRYRPELNSFQRIYLGLPNAPPFESRYYFTYLDSTADQLYAIAEDNLFVLDITEKGYSFDHIEPFDASVKDRMFLDTTNNQLHYLGFGSKSPILNLRQYRAGTISSPAVTYENPFGDDISDVALDPEGHCWLGAEEGLIRFDRSTNSWIRMPTYQGDSIKAIRQLALLEDGRLIVGTQDGPIYIFDTEQEVYTGQLLYQRDGIVLQFDRPFDRLNVDRQQNIWIGTNGQGVFHTNIDKPRIGLYGLEVGQAYGAVNASLEDRQGDIWVLQPQRLRHYSSQDTTIIELPVTGGDKEQTTYIQEDENRNIWLGTLDRLFIKPAASNQLSPLEVLVDGDSLSNRGFNAQLQLPDGRWLFAPNQSKVFTSCTDLREYNNSSTLYQLEGNYLEASTRGTRIMTISPTEILATYSNNDSLVIGPYANGQWVVDTVLTDLPLVTGISYDERLDLFWLSSYRGLFRLQQQEAGEWQLLREQKVDENSTIQSLVLTEGGQLWMSGQACLMQYTPGEEVEYFRIADGLQGADFNLYAAMQATDGRLYFGGTQGLNVFHPDSVAPRMPDARPQFTRIIINDDPAIFSNYNLSGTHDPLATEGLVLPHWMNSIELKLSALEYSAPQDCQFKYRLLGSSNESWSKASTTPSIPLRSLGYGSYTVELKASNSDGKWAEEIRRLSIRIRPPWYLRWWFLSCLGLLLLGSVISYIRKRAKRKLAEANIRTAMARLTMNPHVLFNGLGATGRLIKEGEYKAARFYLTKFSKWMKNLMDNSNKPLIRLDAEINLLEKYITIEQFRVSKTRPFSYQLKLAPEIEPIDHYLPPLLFQPFVENAIIHGFSQMESGGQLEINFYQEGLFLIGEITDNGPGRAANKQRLLELSELEQEHNGIATPTARERIRMMNTSAGRKVATFSIIDLQAQHGQPSGTKVQFAFEINFLAQLAIDEGL